MHAKDKGMDLDWVATVALLGFSCLALYAVVALVYPILFPTIITCPWPESNNQRDRTLTVVLAGSYNPPHRGHSAMLSYLSEQYGHVIAVVGMNPKKHYKVSPYQRADLLRKMLRGASASNVDVEVVSGYVWRHVKRRKARIFFRGIRTWDKDGREEQQLQILNTWGPLLLGPLWWPIPTVYLEGRPEYNHVSSTLIRDLCRNGNCSLHDLEKVVPATIASDVAQLYAD